MRGKVVRWLPERGFGFIKPDEASERDCFVHVSQMQAAGIHGIEVGDRIEFEIGDNGGRRCAVEIRLLTSSVGGER